ncbi:MAG: hypothetical protein ACRDUA_16740, partial [Micromonosporaceae bacterium]
MTGRLTRNAAVLLAGLALGAVSMLTAATPASAATNTELAARWAPIHYQDTDSTDYDADYLSRIDYDGEWDTLNNWDHQDDNPARLTGWVYYSVVSTDTHWFIVYAYYHPRDWCDWPFCGGADSHENDMEGLVLTVRRDGSTYGRFEAMVTVAHTNFYSYTPSGSPYTGGRENIDGTVVMQSYGGHARPTTFQEAKGHGCYAWDGGGFPGGDGVVYYPDAGTAEVPSGGNDRSVRYRLTDVFASGGLWGHRNDPATFASWGTFRGDNGKDNSANAPWGWDDSDDGSDLQRGLLATDPALLVSAYFGNEGAFSRTYT